MNNERYNQIVDEVYEKYINSLFYNFSGEVKGYLTHFHLTRVEFINKCKTDTKFSERWGLKIEERELTWKERSNLQTEDQRKGRVPDKNGRMQGEFGNLSPFTEKMIHYWCDQFNIPTKLIIVTYNNETVEVYE